MVEVEGRFQGCDRNEAESQPYDNGLQLQVVQTRDLEAST